jgi:hypothetical protein
MNNQYLGAVFILLLSLNFSCSTMSKRSSDVDSHRIPSAVEGFDCLTPLQGIFENAGRKGELKARFTKLEGALGENETAISDMGSFLSELQQEVIKLDDNELLTQFTRLQDQLLEYSQKAGEGELDFSTFKESWIKQRDNFLESEAAARAQRESTHQENFYALMKEAPLAHRKRWEAASENTKKKSVISYIAKLEFNSELSAKEKERLRYFSFWFLKNKQEEKYGNKVIEEILQEELANFKKTFEGLSNAQKASLEKVGKSEYLELYNDFSMKPFEELSKRGTLKGDAFIYLRLFSELEPRFEGEVFFRWLVDNDKLGENRVKQLKSLSDEEKVPLELGQILRDSYTDFAPFQSRPLIEDIGFLEKSKERVKNFWDNMKGFTRECADLDCVRKRSRNGWFEIFKGDFYKRSFSCLGKNPVVLKSMIMDMGMVWGGLYLYYKSNPESFQRFPYEIMVNGMIFGPVMAEANCRASFKNQVPFGGPIPSKEILPNGWKKSLRYLSSMQGVAFKGFLASAGLLGMSIGFDHLALAMGEAIVKPMGLNEMIMLLPIAYMYHGIWMGFKNLAIVNPIRHKVIPRLAKAIERKSKVRGTYWILQTGMDFGAYSALAAYNNWDYLAIYTALLFPYVAESFPAGTDLNRSSTIGPRGERIEVITGENENGVRTETTVVEENGTVRVDSVDVEVPDDVIDSWADQILKAN